MEMTCGGHLTLKKPGSIFLSTTMHATPIEQVFVTNGVDSMQFLEIEVPSCHPSSSSYSKKLSQGEMINRQLLHRINGEMEFVVSLRFLQHLDT